MALDTCMQIEGIPGESLDAVFKDWIELSDFDVGASQPASQRQRLQQVPAVQAVVEPV
ncbi:hypothetical protein PSE10C_28470 [Pseudomonas amygdali pv. eriobotryae]|uniref:Uncharacterized protein n=1 Tax=Pseudomonas amygdali pv. eriobotryae TaxID=129137 RepID=A0A3M3AT61_PSEA0|nr:hypothetical protein ALQ86_03761 [Pseudomonas amygdali pv. eriobotryae]GFZ61420.1 hypothetical protein PSE10A_39310 [Pseudomonas amygdali pv. eriobotryae]GFZ72105.1 hypothetical protein PSE10C_28470 [Pseudomonas amygdali pv. eriobotryae]